MTLHLHDLASNALQVTSCKEEVHHSGEYTHYIFSANDNTIELFEKNGRYFLAYESYYQPSDCGRRFATLQKVEVLGPKLSTLAPGCSDELTQFADQLSKTLNAYNAYFTVFANTLRLTKNNGRDFSTAEVLPNDAFQQKARQIISGKV